MEGGFDVHKVARLASLGLTLEEEERLRRDFAAILELVAQVKALDLEGVEPSIHALAPELPLRPDQPRPSLATDAALDAAPVRHDDFFQVPTILTEEQA